MTSGDVLQVAVAAHPTRRGVVQVRVAGELDAAACPQLRAALAAAAAADPSLLELDLGGVTFCSGTAVAELCAAERRLAIVGGGVVVAAASRPVRRLLDLLGLGRLLHPGSARPAV
ncbi:STAS domain-containing protein [Dactylosporangium salmoneum]|uniref:STAS domain-containing protein n=1 Tax=Dactylosporangium salmoneum TaxID=53361 RepID=UPI003CD09D8B